MEAFVRGKDTQQGVVFWRYWKIFVVGSVYELEHSFNGERSLVGKLDDAILSFLLIDQYRVVSASSKWLLTLKASFLQAFSKYCDWLQITAL